ncbi:ECF-type riboflavin transporter substrate-binding protein [Streptococcaceae bacterium ESL0687]|nr:ECF-type riboflavin transporter substrate-binding protein [Streptococcaceae bacterium ESL0687]
MKKLSIKSVVATGIGAALFVIVALYIRIPLFPNTDIQLQYAVLTLFSGLFGPIPGFLIGFIGHTLKDSIAYGAPWWTWSLASGLLGIVLGYAAKASDLENGNFGKAQIIRFNVIQVIGNIVIWGLLAPLGDVLIYSEPSNKVFTQGVIAVISNSLTIGIGGTLLLVLYAKSRTKEGSLTKD